jgi:hypothetical protein
MRTRSPLYRLALEANEGRANIGDDVLPIPTLDERVSLYLRAVHGNRNFTEQQRSNARNVLLDSMAAEIVAQVQPEVTGSLPLHPYEAPTQDWQNVQRKETIRAAPFARRRTGILSLTATLGLVLIVAGGTLGYRWTYPHMADEVTTAAPQAQVPPPTTSPRSLSIRSASDKVAPEQHVVRIESQRSEAEVLVVFRRLQEEQPTLFGQATLKRIDSGPQSYTAQAGPFASEKEAAAVCRSLEAADIQCLGQR